MTLLDGSKGFSPLRQIMRTPLLILMGMVGLLTLMATANVGSLLLVGPQDESERCPFALPWARHPRG